MRGFCGWVVPPRGRVWNRVTLTAVVLLGSLVPAGCLDQAPSPLSLTIRPSLSSDFPAFAALFGIRRVRVQAWRLDQTAAVFDSRLPVGTGISLDVPPSVGRGPGDFLRIRLEYPGSAGVLRFTGEDTVPIAGIGAEREIAIHYMGPGREVAFLTVTPVDTLLTDGDSLQLRVVAYDSAGLAVADPPILWQSDNPSVPASSQGMVLAPTGVAHALIYAVLPTGRSAFVRVFFTPDSLAVLPESVEVLPGAAVTFQPRAHFSLATVVWSVNGVAGGGPASGSILDGAFLAPAAVPTPATETVCASVSTAQRCSRVTIRTPPSAGGDVVVLGDVSMLENAGLAHAGNRTLLRQILVFPASGPRSTGGTVLLDRGRLSRCLANGSCADSSLDSLQNEILADGMQAERIDTLVRWRDLPTSVRVLVVWTPQVPFDATEINAYRRFAAEGGRVVLVADDTLSYGGASGLGLYSVGDLLGHLGTTLRPYPVDLDCPLAPGSGELRLTPHQITSGITNLFVSCGLGVTTGTNGFGLVGTGPDYIAAVAKVDVTPILGFGCVCGAAVGTTSASACECGGNRPGSR